MKREQCDPSCVGWAIFNSTEVQRCDDCAHLQGNNAQFPSDLHAAAEALASLTRLLDDEEAHSPDTDLRRHDNDLRAIVQTLMLDLTGSRSKTEKLMIQLETD